MLNWCKRIRRILLLYKS